MVQLIDADIRTREVLQWKGVHVLHFPLSSCSQKLRIFLNLKGVDWQSHLVDLFSNENLTEWFLGVNPRGLVPVLIHDGVVHIESNDIIVYCDKAFSGPKLIPAGFEGAVATLLKHEDDLHFDLRALSFRFVFAPPAPPKSADDLRRYATRSSGSVQGKKDAAIAAQIAFWRQYLDTGITDDAVRASTARFRRSFGELDERLAAQPYLFGARLSVLDIAWFIYVNRLSLAGYPFARMHPRVGEWYERLFERPEFSKEVELPTALNEQFAATRRTHAKMGKSLEMIAGF